MLNFKIDESKCTRCGLCAKDCLVGIIDMNDIPTIKSDKESSCIKCQHCMTICPTGALSIWDKDPANSLKNSGNLPDSKMLSEMIKTRRSIRNYKQETLDNKLIRELLKTASYAPTGHNKNGVHFMVIDDSETMQMFKESVYNSIKKLGEAGALKPPMDYIYEWQKDWVETGVDRLFWNAPHLLIATAPSNDTSPVQDALIALSYFELLANSNGIGTLWDGYVKWIINDLDSSLRKIIGIPDDHEVGFVMLFGKPAIKYPRAIQSDGIHISSIKLK